MKKLLYLTFLIFITSAVFAQIKYVPTDYEIIQHAIDDAQDGDTIIVEPGIYCQQIDFKGKAITVASRYLLDPDTSYISNTIIDGMFLDDGDSLSLVYFVSGEDSTSVLCGFTLQNGKGTIGPVGDHTFCAGGAIFFDYSGAKISNNIIKDNHSINPNGYTGTWDGAWGGGIDCAGLPKDRTLIITENIFKNNFIHSKYNQAMGGAIDIINTYGTVIITKNKIIGNKVESVKSGYGGGICIAGTSGDAKILIENNYISGNSTYARLGSTKGGGVACLFSAPIIRNNIIVYNKTEYPPLLNTNDAFGGGIAVFWYQSLWKSDWDICEDPYNLLVTIENNTIAYNNDKMAGGGVALRSVAANLKNNIIGCNFSNNDAQIKVEYPDAIETESRTVKVDYCNVEGGVEAISKFYNGIGNINEFPEFSDEEHWYLKRDLSPCIDSGDPSKDYEDIEDPFISGRACFPALGTKRNDIGAFGGPISKWQQVADPTAIEDLVSTEIPNVPYLAQNYPNPFNPSTTIKYAIPSSTVISNPQGGERSQNLNNTEIPNHTSASSVSVRDDMLKVSLKIYDILGREVATLVNEKLKPGNYEVDFNANGLASGIYFYKLSAGASTGLSADKAGSATSFIQTKKMLMIK